jgi:hypothetical protein
VSRHGYRDFQKISTGLSWGADSVTYTTLASTRSRGYGLASRILVDPVNFTSAEVGYLPADPKLKTVENLLLGEAKRLTPMAPLQ